MASRWWSASMLLASLMSLYWMTSADQPHVSLTADLSPSYRVRRDLPEDTREKVQASAQAVNDFVTVVTDIFQLEAVKKASDIIAKISNCASLVPGIGGLVSSIISMSLAFIPQDDPVLKAVQKGFAEVNRKLDSLSIQIADLATDVEWHNYISTYSRDERHILNAWRRFNAFLEDSKLIQNRKDQRRLKRTFIRQYENTGAEDNMLNLYHYLTVNQTSLTVNINELLKKKFKCDVGQISKYNFYLNSLLWKGMVVNQFYWKCKNLTKVDKKAKHTEMFKNVTEAQIATIEFCLNRSEDYMKKDVIEITKTLSPDDKETIAGQVKKSLDQKYNWYNWVVLVYDNSSDKNMLLYNMTKIPVGDIIVAVDYTVEAEIKEERIKELADTCFKDTNCKKLPECIDCLTPVNGDQHPCVTVNFADHGKVVYVASVENYKVEPKPFYNVFCYRDRYSSYWSTFKYSNYWDNAKPYAFIYFSRKLPVCTDNKCKNGKCVRLLNSNESWCKCKDGYYGDTCEKNIMF